MNAFGATPESPQRRRMVVAGGRARVRRRRRRCPRRACRGTTTCGRAASFAGVARAGAGERARDDDLPVRELRLPEREAGRRREARAAQERVRVVDAVVDDADLDSLAVRARRRVEDVGADHGRAAVQREVVREARPDARRRSSGARASAAACAGSETANAVEDDLVAPARRARRASRAASCAIAAVCCASIRARYAFDALERTFSRCAAPAA